MNTFDPSTMKKHCKIQIIGDRDSRSDFVVDYLTKHKQQYSLGMCISPKEGKKKLYTGKIPSDYIHDNFREKLYRRFKKELATVDDASGYFIIEDPSKGDLKDLAEDLYGNEQPITYIIVSDEPILKSYDYVFVCKGIRLDKLATYWKFSVTNVLKSLYDEKGACLVIDNTEVGDRLFSYNPSADTTKNNKSKNKMEEDEDSYESDYWDESYETDYSSDEDWDDDETSEDSAEDTNDYTSSDVTDDTTDDAPSDATTSHSTESENDSE